jgi:hypothetical protein
MALEDHDADARPASLEEETRTVIEEARAQAARAKNRRGSGSRIAG